MENKFETIEDIIAHKTFKVGCFGQVDKNTWRHPAPMNPHFAMHYQCSRCGVQLQCREESLKRIAEIELSARKGIISSAEKYANIHRKAVEEIHAWFNELMRFPNAAKTPNFARNLERMSVLMTRIQEKMEKLK